MARSRAAARRLILRSLIDEQGLGSQKELAEALAARGHAVAQTTISRDLSAIGARKTHDAEGGESYALASATGGANAAALRARLTEFVVGIDASLNLAVVKTRPGAAATVAAALDEHGLSGLVGTLAGDDTVLAIGRDARGGARLKKKLAAILEG